MLKDPVCGMDVKEDAPLHHEHEGRTYRFCSEGCLEKFKQDPGRYLSDEKPDEPPADPEAIYTCPMHPEVRQKGPGDCPKCGMALEPEAPTGTDDAQDDAETRDMLRRFWVSVAFAAAVLGVAMGDMLPGRPVSSLIGSAWRHWVELLLATPVCLYGAWPFYVRAVRSIRTLNLNMFTLIGLGVTVAYGYSLVVVVAPDLFPDSLRDAEGNLGVYFEAAATIVALILLGQVLEGRARRKTGSAIRKLLDLAPKKARRIEEDGSETDIDLADLEKGDRVRVRPGEKIPADGVVVEGSSAVDKSMVSGESMPESVSESDEVVGGTVNTTGSLIVEITKTGSETLLSRMVAMVAEAQRSRAPIQKLADRVAAVFVPAVVAVA
ncbi:MAG: HAD-IC family P-type ATPase, partial [Phycisphaeraceae bacterium]|nr:HAD-IC family P-type ATPase [Phycisphaeraceae bacterium]